MTDAKNTIPMKASEVFMKLFEKITKRQGFLFLSLASKPILPHKSSDKEDCWIRQI